MPEPNRRFLDELHEELNALDRRIRYLETYETGGTRLFMVHNAGYVLNNVTINSGARRTTADLRGSHNIPATATGVILMTEGLGGAVACRLQVDSAQAPDAFSPQVLFPGGTRANGMLMVAFNAAGEVTYAATGANISQIYSWVVGFWI